MFTLTDAVGLLRGECQGQWRVQQRPVGVDRWRAVLAGSPVASTLAVMWPDE